MERSAAANAGGALGAGVVDAQEVVRTPRPAQQNEGRRSGPFAAASPAAHPTYLRVAAPDAADSRPPVRGLLLISLGSCPVPPPARAPSFRRPVRVPARRSTAAGAPRSVLRHALNAP
ncbi:hypothetical protein HYPSUDRAFT_201462 [Hypholoma sublateritium FD-334 SS-4]|uniref:Uncharacterized protein n=1 Tax=Hypholoma sublateritium (strain FD-334 SS-4) TaxID=945553 RepID=A0A0D2PV75_HYPSF|nr:hypothetical protein HYPSUDRAFT_201462 [Hypholoma sublateritium FD-334 SS-4]